MRLKSRMRLEFSRSLILKLSLNLMKRRIEFPTIEMIIHLNNKMQRQRFKKM